MSEIIGITTYANGEQQTFTDSTASIKTIQEELPYRSTSGFAYKILTTDAATRKAVDDLVYNEYGEENPHDLAYYQSTKGETAQMTSEEFNTALYQKMFAEEDKDHWGSDRCCEFVVDRAHPGLVDLFVTQARHEYLLTQPLTKEDIQQEAARLLGRLQEPSQPNSPKGTHYMA